MNEILINGTKVYDNEATGIYKEIFLQRLLKDLYEKNTLDVYDYTAITFGSDSNEFCNTKVYADQLVRDKLAKYLNDDHSVLHITNFGRYWMLKGGYETFLIEGQFTKERQKERSNSIEKEKLLEARLRLTHYRLTGFWLALVISCVGFVLSLFNLYMLLKTR